MNQKGFTLIEVMITAAIIAILVMVALPSYRDYTVRANRSAAASYVMEVANMQERNFLDERSNAATPPTYTVSAVPKSGQASDDSCGTLTLNSQGQKGHAAGGARCWD